VIAVNFGGKPVGPLALDETGKPTARPGISRKEQREDN
jgi:hypothetical protein